MELTVIQKITIAIIPILFAITLHEAAHGFVASLCGDQTAKLSGRLSLNPIQHMDLMGTVIVPLLTLAAGGILFGWAKPVPIDERNLKHGRRDIIFVSLAGPAANLLMAFAWAAIAKLATYLGAAQGGAPLALLLMGHFGISINLFIMLFNLLPIPPLDGSRILAVFLKGRWAYQYYRIAPYSFFILLALILFNGLNFLIIPYQFLFTMISFIFGL
ncbi:MAG: peptidase [Gammaproteobacteria bacterium]|jgi:Zn-dependent protease|nr:peptidase [Gammaproteobacteria bacterium]